MDTEQMIKELVESPKYIERADVRTVIDEAVDGLRGQTSKERVKEVLDTLKEELAAVLNLGTTPELEPISGAAPRNLAAIKKSIDALALTPQAKEKLKQMFDGYDESVATAKEVDPIVQIKTITEVYREFAKLGLPKLKEIAEFARPMLLVVPKNSFLEKKAEMNKHKPYIRPGDDQPQDDAYHWNGDGSPFKNVTDPTEITVSVVDGAARMPHIQGIPSDLRFDERKKAFKTHFTAKGMRLINVHEDAVLIQRSLREYERSGKNVDKIVDYYESSNETVSCLDDQYLINSTNVAYGYFHSRDRQVGFGASNPDLTLDDLRGRPSVQVMKY